EDERRDGNRRRQSREFHIDLLHVLFAPRQRLPHEGTQHGAGGCSAEIFFAVGEGRRAYKRVSLPLSMTGPGGGPVGDPRGGSSDTASVASGVRRPARSGGMVRRIGSPGWMSPSERGRWLGRISHSSMARGPFVSSVAGTTRRLSPVAVTAATKFGWPLVPARVAISGAPGGGAQPK